MSLSAIHPPRYIVFECIVALGGVSSGTIRQLLVTFRGNSSGHNFNAEVDESQWAPLGKKGRRWTIRCYKSVYCFVATGRGCFRLGMIPCSHGLAVGLLLSFFPASVWHTGLDSHLLLDRTGVGPSHELLTGGETGSWFWGRIWIDSASGRYRSSDWKRMPWVY